MCSSNAFESCRMAPEKNRKKIGNKSENSEKSGKLLLLICSLRRKGKACKSMSQSIVKKGSCDEIPKAKIDVCRFTFPYYISISRKTYCFHFDQIPKLR